MEKSKAETVKVAGSIKEEESKKLDEECSMKEKILTSKIYPPKET